jgi:predicted HicB family RNase H-like nuclease
MRKISQNNKITVLDKIKIFREKNIKINDYIQFVRTAFIRTAFVRKSFVRIAIC